jgi:undecaprenyl diphosphate synthase
MMEGAKPPKLSHVAIIMDGNGRWAKSRSHLRVWGHIRGSKVVTDIVEEASDLGLHELTLYAFSQENWSRPVHEIQTLFSLLRKFLLRERTKIIENSIRFRVMGDISRLSPETQNLIRGLESTTLENSGLRLNFAFNYGGRSDIVETFKRLDKREISEEELGRSFDIPNVDLLIRTGGEMRISNFLIWQIAYAELYFSKTMWPDFTREEFRDIIQEFFQRERRYGSINAARDWDYSRKEARKNKELFNH